jgi:KaiC/GvpD/RAD55 family RecA-like ATPase
MSGVRSLLAAFLRSRGAFERVGHLLGTELGEQERVLLSAIDEYYERDSGATSCDPDLISAAIGRTLANPKHQEQFKKLVQGLWETDTSAPNVVQDFIEVRRTAVGNRLATALAAGKGTADIAPLLSEYSEWAGKTDLGEQPEAQVAVAKSVTELVASRTREGGLLRVAPSSLNERLGGGLLRGHHLIVFARPEVGKTMVLINMACMFARQNLKVLYFSNEDPIDDLVMRAVNRLSDMDRASVIENPQEAEAAALSNGYANIGFRELTPGTPEEIERVAREYSADVIIIDQLRNLNTGDDNFVRALEKSASAVRTIGKRLNALVVSSTQAGDSASGKSVLEMGDVDSSNTGIPAQCDVLLGIGMSQDDEARGMRVFSLCKNKPGNNHEYFAVTVDPKLSKVSS